MKRVEEILGENDEGRSALEISKKVLERSADWGSIRFDHKIRTKVF